MHECRIKSKTGIYILKLIKVLVFTLEEKAKITGDKEKLSDDMERL